jgi:hypothetical protein
MAPALMLGLPLTLTTSLQMTKVGTEYKKCLSRNSYYNQKDLHWSLQNDLFPFLDDDTTTSLPLLHSFELMSFLLLLQKGTRQGLTSSTTTISLTCPWTAMMMTTELE